MKTIKLGKSELKVSRVGIGGIPLTRPLEKDAIKIIQHAIDIGVNFIDTAIGYGISEERIGKAIIDRREDVIIATKGSRGEHIDFSLSRLNIEYIDLWQFHGINSFEYLDWALGQGLVEIKEALNAGKIRHIGFSSHSLEVSKKAVVSDAFETVQFPFNFISNEAMDDLLPLAEEHHVGFIAMKPFAGGRIQNANLAIKYLLQFDNVMPDPGIERIEEIDEIVNIANNESWELTSSELQDIQKIREQIGTRFCRQCEYCMPCPQGVIICGVLYLENLWNLWPPDWYYSWNYVNDSAASAKKCIQCGECELKCPYNLPIREMIKENLRFYEKLQQEKT